MAAIYDVNGNTITEGLQGSRWCDDAISVARSIASDRGQTVVLDDDDGRWMVHPDGRADPICIVDLDVAAAESGGFTVTLGYEDDLSDVRHVDGDDGGAANVLARILGEAVDKGEIEVDEDGWAHWVRT